MKHSFHPSSKRLLLALLLFTQYSFADENNGLPPIYDLMNRKTAINIHFTDLIEDSINQGKKVGVFPIDNDAWIDVGQWTEYKQAVESFDGKN